MGCCARIIDKVHMAHRNVWVFFFSPLRFIFDAFPSSLKRVWLSEKSLNHESPCFNINKIKNGHKQMNVMRVSLMLFALVQFSAGQE